MTKGEIKAMVLASAEEIKQGGADRLSRGMDDLWMELGLDSLDVVELTLYVEDEMKLGFPNEVTDGSQTPQELVDSMAKHLGAK